jgi:hypothetical protein
LTPIMVGVFGYLLASLANKADKKLDDIHVLVNDNLTKAKANELIALEAWAMSMEAHPDRNPSALIELRERIESLRNEIEERDRIAYGIPSLRD